jgi:hypothetical protein
VSSRFTSSSESSAPARTSHKPGSRSTASRRTPPAAPHTTGIDSRAAYPSSAHSSLAPLRVYPAHRSARRAAFH